LVSVHPHNDRGTAVATAELGLMAGADRVEGTLFGNGERTGNVDLITIALNLLTQGVDPRLDLSQLDEAKAIVEACNELPIHPRHPWVGELVYTAFSGSHQDAIKKGMYAQQREGSEIWDVPYLPIDPADLGRSYEAIIRVNSQSGKGGVAYLMETEHSLELPRGLQVEFAQKVQSITDARGDELTADELLEAFHEHYLAHTSPYELGSYTHSSSDTDQIVAELVVEGSAQEISGSGNGPIAALVDAFEQTFGTSIKIRNYHEHAMAAAADATAAAYIEADVDGDLVWGVALHPSIVTASLRAVVNAVNRALAQRKALEEAMLFG
jgi:2-isopropylmalate synthase